MCDSSWRRPDVMFPLPVTVNTLAFQNYPDFQGLYWQLHSFSLSFGGIDPKKLFFPMVDTQGSSLSRFQLEPTSQVYSSTSALWQDSSNGSFMSLWSLTKIHKNKPIAKHQSSSRMCYSSPQSTQRHTEVNQGFLHSCTFMFSLYLSTGVGLTIQVDY